MEFNENNLEVKETENKKSFSKGKISIVLILLVLVIAALVGYRIFGKEKKIDTEPLASVSVTHAVRGDIEIETSLIGTVSPGDVYYVVPKVAGEVIDIKVSTGDKVKAGDPICVIDNQKAIDAAKLALDGSNVKIKTCEDAVNLARTNLDRMSALLATGDISRQTYESTKNGYDQAVAALDGAKLELQGNQLSYDTQVEFATVTAPVSGTVESTNMSLNGMVSSASQVCVIASNGANKITFNVTDRLLNSLKVGDPLVITKQGSEYAAKITSVSKLPSQASGLYPIEAAFTENASIANGASVKISFVSEKAENALLVDTDVISYDGGAKYIYTITYNDTNDAADANAQSGAQTIISENNKAGTVHKHKVETGLSNAEKTEILSGTDEDSLIIQSWTSQLYEGAQVQVLPEE